MFTIQPSDTIYKEYYGVNGNPLSITITIPIKTAACVS